VLISSRSRAAAALAESVCTPPHRNKFGQTANPFRRTPFHEPNQRTPGNASPLEYGGQDKTYSERHRGHSRDPCKRRQVFSLQWLQRQQIGGSVFILSVEVAIKGLS